MPKTESARQRIEELNPDVRVVTYAERLTSENIDRLLEGVDVVVDGTDNFPTRYLLNDAWLLKRIPVVHGSIFRFEGQVTVFKPYEGPCYRCLLPQPPPPGSSRHHAPRAASSASCPASWAPCRRARRSKLLLGIGEA